MHGTTIIIIILLFEPFPKEAFDLICNNGGVLFAIDSLYCRSPFRSPFSFFLVVGSLAIVAIIAVADAAAAAFFLAAVLMAQHLPCLGARPLFVIRPNVLLVVSAQVYNFLRRPLRIPHNAPFQALPHGGSVVSTILATSVVVIITTATILRRRLCCEFRWIQKDYSIQ